MVEKWLQLELKHNQRQVFDISGKLHTNLVKAFMYKKIKK